jgi:hypothetical protein
MFRIHDASDAFLVGVFFFMGCVASLSTVLIQLSTDASTPTLLLLLQFLLIPMV